MSHPITKEEFREALQNHVDEMKSKRDVCKCCNGWGKEFFGDAKYLAGTAELTSRQCIECKGNGYLPFGENK